MQTNQDPITTRTFLKTCAAALAGTGALSATADPAPAADALKGKHIRLRINAGTVFNLNAVGNPPWSHQVRGMAQVSNLGNCRVAFQATILAGTQGHQFDLVGTMTITTLAGDQLLAGVSGWADPDPDDPNQSTYRLYYDVIIEGGTGSLQGAKGTGEIEGVFAFFLPYDPEDPDDPNTLFCDKYAGVATWLFEGVMVLPRPRK